MSNPREQQQEPDKLDLDAATVKDLELSDDAAKDVEGGWIRPPITWACPQPH